ncbi:MAG: hypothetical protein AB8B56_00945 [Crocinitomicaceae bacterium]
MKTISHFTALSVLLVLLMGLGACNKDSTAVCTEHAVADCNPDPNKVNIRVKNVSDYDMCNFVLWPYDEKFNCGIIEAGESTCYRSFDIAYSYGYLKFYISEKEFILQPFDFVGEVPLQNGYYTYSVDVNFDTGQIYLECSE